MSRPDAVVVGAGIVGAACADALAAEGLGVVVLESRFAGGGTTAAGMGHVVVMDGSPAELALTAWSRQLWAELARELPRECEDEACGTLWVAAADDEMEQALARARVYAEHGVAAEVLTARELAETEPNLRSGLAGGLRVPDDRVVYPPAVVRFLLARAAARGAECREAWPVETLEAGVVISPRGRLEADVVVNAAGAEAARLTPGLPIAPRKGHLVITERYPGFCRHQLVELGYLKSAHGEAPESVAFNVQPRATGQLLIGSTRERVGWDATLNRGLVSRMLVRATAYLPRLTDLQALRTWVGFRPATPDGLPLIGPWPAQRGLFIAAGHEGLGITTALATGRLLADQILGRKPVIDAAPFLPARGGAAHA